MKPPYRTTEEIRAIANRKQSEDKVHPAPGDILAPPHEQIMFILGGVKTSIDELNRRVGIQNGGVKEALNRIASLEETRTFSAGKTKMFSETWQVLVAILGSGGVLWGIIALIQLLKHS